MTPTMKRIKFDALRARYLAARREITRTKNELRVFYGSPQWAKSSERKRLKELDARVNKASDAFMVLLDEISPRDWHHGVPAWWIYEKLSFEDAIRPMDEPLSVVPPIAYGHSEPVR